MDSVWRLEGPVRGCRRPTPHCAEDCVPPWTQALSPFPRKVPSVAACTWGCRYGNAVCSGSSGIRSHGGLAVIGPSIEKRGEATRLTHEAGSSASVCPMVRKYTERCVVFSFGRRYRGPPIIRCARTCQRESRNQSLICAGRQDMELRSGLSGWIQRIRKAAARGAASTADTGQGQPYQAGNPDTERGEQSVPVARPSLKKSYYCLSCGKSGD